MLFLQTIERKLKKVKKNKYLDLVKVKNWNMKVTVIPIIVGALGTIVQLSGKETEGT